MSGRWRGSPGWRMPSRRRQGAGLLGQASDQAQRALAECLGVLEIERPEERLRGLEDEISRETPFRERFFRVLAHRVVRRGRPVVFLPFTHRLEDGGSVLARPAWAWTETSGNRVLALAPNGEKGAWTIEDFSRRFVRDNFA